MADQEVSEGAIDPLRVIAVIQREAPSVLELALRQVKLEMAEERVKTLEERLASLAIPVAGDVPGVPEH